MVKCREIFTTEWLITLGALAEKRNFHFKKVSGKSFHGHIQRATNGTPLSSDSFAPEINQWQAKELFYYQWANSNAFSVKAN